MDGWAYCSLDDKFFARRPSCVDGWTDRWTTPAARRCIWTVGAPNRTTALTNIIGDVSAVAGYFEVYDAPAADPAALVLRLTGNGAALKLQGPVASVLVSRTGFFTVKLRYATSLALGAGAQASWTSVAAAESPPLPGRGPPVLSGAGALPPPLPPLALALATGTAMAASQQDLLSALSAGTCAADPAMKPPPLGTTGGVVSASSN